MNGSGYPKSLESYPAPQTASPELLVAVIALAIRGLTLETDEQRAERFTLQSRHDSLADMAQHAFDDLSNIDKKLIELGIEFSEGKPLSAMPLTPELAQARGLQVQTLSRSGLKSIAETFAARVLAMLPEIIARVQGFAAEKVAAERQLFASAGLAPVYAVERSFLNHTLAAATLRLQKQQNGLIAGTHRGAPKWMCPWLDWTANTSTAPTQ